MRSNLSVELFLYLVHCYKESSGCITVGSDVRKINIMLKTAN